MSSPKWLVEQLQETAHAAIRTALNTVGLESVEEFKLSPPAREDMGDLGLACHPFARILRKSPNSIAEDVAAQVPSGDGIASVEAINGYVNLKFDTQYVLTQSILEIFEAGEQLGELQEHPNEKLLIEFSGPNTNKPQHLGHVRNNILGLSSSNILESAGYTMTRVNIINDRGIHICKSMLAYQLFGEGKTPKSEQRKGDFFVGDYYVLFDQKFNAEYKASDAYEAWLEAHPNARKRLDVYAAWKAENPNESLSSQIKDGLHKELGLSKEDIEKLDKEGKEHKETYFNQTSELGLAAKEMLRKWEEEDEEVRTLWQQMNQWVYDGFNETYARLGIQFDWVDYENETYILGKDVVHDGIEKGFFHKREDQATVCDLTQIGKEGQKVLLRPDGTSLYMTQDLGTAMRRLEKFSPDRMLYVVADEQNYHFNLLFGILDLFGDNLGSRCHHLSYGMVELPHGKMKSREGTVVDADTLMSELQTLALVKVKEHYPNLSEEEALDRAEKIGQAGLKYFILKFTPGSRIHFDPEKSIEFQGETGPYCLYSYARVNSIRSKMPEDFVEAAPTAEELASLGTDDEIHLAKLLMQFPLVVRDAATQINPARITRYVYEVAHAYASFYQKKNLHPIITAESPQREARFALSRATQAVLKKGLNLLGIDTIDQM